MPDAAAPLRENPDAPPGEPAEPPPAASPGDDTSTHSGLLTVYAAYVFRYVYPLIMVPFYSRVLGAAAYGRVLAAMSLLQMVRMVVEYGFVATGTRDAASTRDRSQLAAIYGQQLAGRCALAPFGLALGAAGIALSPVLSERPVLSILAALSGVFAAFNVGWFMQGTQHFRTSVLLELLGFPLVLPVVLLFMRGPQDDWLVFASLLVACIVGALLGHALVLRQIERVGMRVTGALTLVRGSTPLFAARGMSLVMSNSSTYLVSMFATATQVGLYGAAERLAGATIGLMLPAQQVLVSTICNRLASKGEEASGYALIRKAVVVMAGAGLLMLAATLALSDFVVPVILGAEFAPSVPILHVLALMFPFAAIAQVITSCILIPLRLDRLATQTSFAAAAVTVGTVFAFTGPFGGIGAAWGRVAGYTVMAAVAFELLRRKQLLALLPSVAAQRDRAA